MASLFPNTSYAEDLPSAHAILYLHVMRASAMTFSFLSLPLSGVTFLVSRLRRQPVTITTALSRTLLNCGRGLVVGTVAGAAMTWGRMRGREEIEWQDRSWRLLENKGEVDTDWETMAATSAGAVAGVVAARRGVLPVSLGNAALGGAGVGLSSGVLFMIGTYAAGRKPA
ncbi:uncharacterized protein EKO05_0006618 [Ascochyta rabiei]|uniref:Uncharacterized protein n=1 Tax=Didymella rabiei TaxID=5454 RepID=A0A162W6P9_DIDRA|nr:uncharacterized protein EKO05_0006618 [Ascochyta rabiei]KZM18834.1 hypothetical protein ST47_g10024 [Ascochyta rabiei]UPX16204.1 hypothetical protein EKO05_0006618 [Ascochyta rabiei]